MKLNETGQITEKKELGGRPAPPAAHHSPARFRMLALIAGGTMINYLDRTLMGVAAPKLSSELHLDPVWMGIVFSAFSWSYAAAQIPGGIFLDRFGNKLTYGLAIAFWSTFTLLQGFARGLASLLTFRLGLGVSEAPCFPVNSRVVAQWFPERERARATAVYTVGEYLGLACFGPLMFWIVEQFGWRSLFIAVGILGVAFSGVWKLFYFDPPAELTPKLTADGSGAVAAVPERVPFAWANVRKLLSYRQIWGACIGQFGGNSTLVFFLTWFPTYLATERHMPWIKAGVFSILPFIAGGCGVMTGGWVSDTILKRTGSATWARKLPIITGLLGASTIIAANYVASNTVVIAILSFAFFCQGMTGLGFAVISDIAPRQMIGLTAGIFNFATNFAGVLTPLVIGYIVARTGSFVYGLAYTGAVAMLGAISYIFILGDVKRIEMDS